MSDEDVDRSALEAEAEVLPERELMSLISPDTSVGALPMPGLDDVEAAPTAAPASDAPGTVPVDAEGSAGEAESGTDDDRSEHISQSDSASSTT